MYFVDMNLAVDISGNEADVGEINDIMSALNHNIDLLLDDDEENEKIMNIYEFQAHEIVGEDEELLHHLLFFVSDPHAAEHKTKFGIR